MSPLVIPYQYSSHGYNMKKIVIRTYSDIKLALATHKLIYISNYVSNKIRQKFLRVNMHLHISDYH